VHVRLEHAPGQRRLTGRVTARRLRAALLVVFAAGISGSACRRAEQPAGDVRVEWRVTPEPPRIGLARVALEVRDAAGRPLSGARLRLEGHMTHPGMAPALADIREQAPGQYEAELSLSMAGDWVLQAAGELPDGRRITRRFDLPGVLPAQ
jgi:hypothetical protein